MDWHGQRRGMASGIGFVLLAFALAGCGIARINHLHSDTNQKQTEKAVEAFQQVTSDRSGLGPSLLKNLDALTALRRTVADGRSKLDDADRATALAEFTWLGLRQEVLKDFGLYKLPDPLPPGGAVVVQRAAVLAGGERLTERIGLRVERVEAVVKVLEALIAGDRALAVQARKDVERSAAKKDEVAKADPASSLIGLLASFQRAVIEAGQQAARDDKARGAATALEKALRDQAAASRAPAAAYALVALVGAGLDDGAFQGLDAFLEHLDERLTGFLEQVKRVPAPLPPEWQAFVDAATRARELTALGYLRSIVSEPSRRRGDGPPRLSERQAQVFTRTLGIVAPIPGVDDLAAVQARITAVRKTIIDASEKITGASGAGATGPAGAKTPIDRLLAITDELSKGIDALRNTLEELPISLESLATLLSAAGGGASDDASRLATGTRLIEKALASNPQLSAGLKSGAIKTEDLKQLGTLVADIRTERGAAAQRVADYLKALRRIQVDLHEENLRHDQATVAIAALEIKRWKLILAIDGDSHRVFQAARPCAGADGKPPEQPAIVLFATPDHVECWEAWYGVWHPGVRRTAPREWAHPVIADADRILPSVRRLAETSRFWQKASPGTNDPRGFDTSMSNQRLWAAARLVNAHLLMLSVNQRRAFENHIRLSNEIAEHALHLDGISVRAEEAGLSLALGDVAAFHASGITQADLQVFFGIIQSALLAYIGGGI